MKALDVPVHNLYGLRPARDKASKEIAPLTAFRDLDTLGLLKNVTTFNFHPHLPHYDLVGENAKTVHVLGRQLIDPDRPHPFTAAGNKEFNAFLWMSPTERAPVTSCWWTRPTSRRCSGAPTAWPISGATSH